jgi:hypothetical protein
MTEPLVSLQPLLNTPNRASVLVVVAPAVRCGQNADMIEGVHGG